MGNAPWSGINRALLAGQAAIRLSASEGGDGSRKFPTSSLWPAACQLRPCHPVTRVEFAVLMVRQSASLWPVVPWPREQNRREKQRKITRKGAYRRPYAWTGPIKGGWTKSGWGSWSGRPNGDATPHLTEHTAPCGVPRNNPWGIWAAEAVFHSRRPVENCSSSTLRRHLAACHGASSRNPLVVCSSVRGRGDEGPRTLGRVGNTV